MKMVTKIDDLVPVRNVIISVSDNRYLDVLLPGLFEYCPEVIVYAANNNYSDIRNLMSRDKVWNNLFSFGQLARNIEVEGTAMEILQPQVLFGLMNKTYCQQHQQLIKEVHAVSIDLAIINLRPIILPEGPNDFESVSTRVDAAGQITLSAACLNSRQVMTLSSPEDYEDFLEEIKRFHGQTCFDSRLKMAKKSALYSKNYGAEINSFLGDSEIVGAKGCYEIRNTVEDFLEAERKAKEAEKHKKEK